MTNFEIRIASWGNSNGIRLPKSALDELNMGPGDLFSMHISEGKIILEPVKKKKKLTLDELFKGYQGPDRAELLNKEAEEWDSMNPVGKEVFD